MKLRVNVDGRSYDVDVDVLDDEPRHDFPPPKPAVPAAVLRERPPQKLPEDSVCRSPIAGRVIGVMSAEGRPVKRNEPVVLLEAMKMEIPIGPAVEGTIKTIHVQPGDPVAAGQVLFDLA